MPSGKILLTGVFGIVAVMVLTAAIHLIAPYAAALTVLAVIFAISTRIGTRRKPDAPPEPASRSQSNWLDWPGE